MPENESKHLAEYIIQSVATDDELYYQIKKAIQNGTDPDWIATSIIVRLIMFLENRLDCAVTIMPPDMRDYYAAGGQEYSGAEALNK